MHDTAFARIWADIDAYFLTPRDGSVVRPPEGSPLRSPRGSHGAAVPDKPAEGGVRRATRRRAA